MAEEFVRIENILQKMTLVEKIDQMGGVRGLHAAFPLTYHLACYPTPDNRRLGIKGLRFTDGPRGINLKNSTCFPVSIARGATWDVDLEKKIGRAMGVEAKARKANAVGAACINIVRHPCGGRSQESYGADPFHLGAMGAALVSGLKENVMPVVKHFACNSIENSRFKVNVRIDERTLREIYLPHFKKCIDAGAACIMSAYNKVNGSYCGQNSRLLKSILKDEWDFDGFTMSDFFLGCRSSAHCIKAGLDMEMPRRFYYSPLAIKRAVTRGRITEKDIDVSVMRILRQKERFGLIGENGSTKLDPGIIHPELALECARKSIVLLKNKNSALPLQNENNRTIAVLGDMAKTANLGAVGSANVNPPYAVSPLKGLKKNKAGILHCSVKPGKRKKALAIAQKADAAIIFAGLKPSDEGEYFPFICGGDRSSLELSQDQVQLILDVAEAAKKTIVVLQGGSAIACGAWIRKVDAVLMAWYPGMEGGNAIADVLFGDVNPSGKLPLTFPASTDQLPQFDNKSDEVIYDYWHDYRYFDHHEKEPLFPFGFGLSYSSFKYSDLSISPGAPGDAIQIKFKITNSGKISGEEVYQIYVGYENSGLNPRSVRELKGFGRVSIEPGGTASIFGEIDPADLAFYDEVAGEWRIEDTPYSLHIGSSSRHIHLTGGFQVRK